MALAFTTVTARSRFAAAGFGVATRCRRMHAEDELTGFFQTRPHCPDLGLLRVRLGSWVPTIVASLGAKALRNGCSVPLAASWRDLGGVLSRRPRRPDPARIDTAGPGPTP